MAFSLFFLIFALPAQAHAAMPDLNHTVACVEEAIQSFPEDGLSIGDDLGWHKDIKEMMTRNGGVLHESDSRFAADWLLKMGATDAKSKLETIYQTADQNQMPPQILAGALSEEASMADFGLSRDYGNWSCGMGQLNILEWCTWARAETPEVQKKINWPRDEISAYLKDNPGRDICSAEFVRSAFAKPFYELALQRMREGNVHRPEFLLTSHFIFEPATVSYEVAAPVLDWIRDKKIPCKRRNRQNDECLAILPSRDEMKATHLRYTMTRSFAEHCGDHHFGIPARGKMVRAIFDALPAEFRENLQNTDQAMYTRKCFHAPAFKGNPLAVGWLAAEAVYNAGEEIVQGLSHYWHEHHQKIDEITPDQFLLAVENTVEKKNSKNAWTR